jgi:hypothetical protein
VSDALAFSAITEDEPHLRAQRLNSDGFRCAIRVRESPLESWIWQSGQGSNRPAAE